MVKVQKRDSNYYLRKLKRLGRDDLLEKCHAGKMSVYAASIEAGFRKRRTAPSRVGHLSYHWSRTSKRERLDFMVQNFREIDMLRTELVQRVKDDQESRAQVEANSQE